MKFWNKIFPKKPKVSYLPDEIKKIEKMKEQIRMAKSEGVEAAHAEKKLKQSNELQSTTGKRGKSVLSQIADNLDSWDKNDPEKDMFKPTMKAGFDSRGDRYKSKKSNKQPKKGKKKKQREESYKDRDYSDDDFFKPTMEFSGKSSKTNDDGFSPTF